MCSHGCMQSCQLKLLEGHTGLAGGCCGHLVKKLDQIPSFDRTELHVIGVTHNVGIFNINIPDK